MNNKKSKQTSRRRARQLWEKYYKACILPGMHLHHIDGNPFNNIISNLLICTPEEHWTIHFEQGDTIAVNGKFIQFSNNWQNLSKEELKKRMENFFKASKEYWSKKENRERRSKEMLGENNPFYGKKHTEYTKKLISERYNTPSGSKHHFFGKKHSEESLKKMRIAKKGKYIGINNPRWKGYVITPKGAFSTSYEAEKVLDLKRRNICYRCNSSLEIWKDWYFDKNYRQ